jgi:HEAT repeat protein
MPLTFRCSKCLEQLFVADNMVGQQCRCGKCSTILSVPPNALHVDSNGMPQPAPPSAAPAQIKPAPRPTPAKKPVRASAPSPAPMPAPMPTTMAGPPAEDGSKVLTVLGGLFILGALAFVVCGSAGVWLYIQLQNSAQETVEGWQKDLKKKVDDAEKDSNPPNNDDDNQPDKKSKTPEQDGGKDNPQAKTPKEKEPVETPKDKQVEPQDTKPPDLAELTKRLTSKDAEVRAKALRAIADMGPDARPALADLMKSLRDSDPEVVKVAEIALKNLEPWTTKDLPVLGAGLRDSSASVRLFALGAIKSLGAEARPALASLLQASGDADAEVGHTALAVVKALGPLTADDVPVLVKALEDKSFKVRGNAIDLLKGMGVEAKSAAGPLAAVVAEHHPALTVAAIEAIAKIGPDARNVTLPKSKTRTVYTTLLGELDHKDEMVRTAALNALDKLGPAEAGDLASLRTMLKRRTGTAESRCFAVKALDSLGADAKPAVTELVDVFLDDADLKVRQLAGKALMGFARDLKSSMAAIARRITDEDGEVRTSALKILAAGTPEAKDTLEALRTALDDKIAGNRALAAQVLGEFGADAAPALEGLLTVLMASEPEPRKQAAIALGRIGKAARVAVPALREAKEGLGDAAETALTRIGTLSKDDVPALSDRLDNTKPVYRVLAAKGLAMLGEDAAPAAAALAKRLADPSPEVRAAAIAALGAIGGKAEEKALPSLCKSLAEDEIAQNRGQVAEILPKVAATKADQAVTALSKSLGDADANVRVKAATAIGSMGAKGKGGAAALGKSAQDKEDAVAKASLEAISKLGPEAAQAAPELLAFLKKSETVEKQLELLKVLSDIGPGAKGVIVELASVGFKDGTNKVLFEGTLSAMEKIGPGDLKALYSVCKSAAPSLRIGGILSLEKAATAADDRDLLRRYLEGRLGSTSSPERDPTVRGVMAEVIAQLRKKV